MSFIHFHETVLSKLNKSTLKRSQSFYAGTQHTTRNPLIIIPVSVTNPRKLNYTLKSSQFSILLPSIFQPNTRTPLSHTTDLIKPCKILQVSHPFDVRKRQMLSCRALFARLYTSHYLTLISQVYIIFASQLQGVPSRWQGGFLRFHSEIKCIIREVFLRKVCRLSRSTAEY